MSERRRDRGSMHARGIGTGIRLALLGMCIALHTALQVESAKGLHPFSLPLNQQHEKEDEQLLR